MKTVEKWLKTIPDETIQTKALTNMEWETRDDLRPTLSNAVHTGFNWIRSPEGYNYWKKVFDNLKKKEQ